MQPHKKQKVGSDLLAVGHKAKAQITHSGMQQNMNIPPKRPLSLLSVPKSRKDNKGKDSSSSAKSEGKQESNQREKKPTPHPHAQGSSEKTGQEQNLLSSKTSFGASTLTKQNGVSEVHNIFHPEKMQKLMQIHDFPPILSQQKQFWRKHLPDIIMRRQLYKENQPLQKIKDDMEELKIEVVNVLEKCLRSNFGGYAPNPESSLPLMWATYRAISTYYIMGILPPEEVRLGCIRFVKNCQAEDGGFGASIDKHSDQKSTMEGLFIMDTCRDSEPACIFRAVDCTHRKRKPIAECSIEELYEIFMISIQSDTQDFIKTEKTVVSNHILSLRREDGGFSNTHHDKSSIIATSHATKLLFLLKHSICFDSTFRESVVYYVTNCFNPTTGGFSSAPYAVGALLSATYLAITTLCLFEQKLDEFALPCLNFVMRCRSLHGFGLSPLILTSQLDNLHMAMALLPILLKSFDQTPNPKTHLRPMDLVTGQPKR